MASSNGRTPDAIDWEGARVYAFRLARRFSGGQLSTVDAEDVANEVITKVYAKRDTIRTHFTAFVATVTRNEVAQFYRRAKYQPPVDGAATGREAPFNWQAPTPQPGPLDRDPADIVEEQETMRETLARFAAALTPLQLCHVMLAAQGLDYPAVAERLGCTETNARVTRWRARKRLRTAYAEVAS